MPRKRRDYKAEYARRKALANAAGYRSVKQYGQARKQLGTPRNAAPLPMRALPESIRERVSGGEIRRLRREAEQWTAVHSHVPASRYRASMSDAQVRAFHHAYVERVDRTKFSRRKAAIEKRNRIYRYLEDFNVIKEKEWHQRYESVTR